MGLSAGVYAITGANGSGKSTLFRVLMSCDTNLKSIDLPESIIMGPKQECESTEDYRNEGDVCQEMTNGNGNSALPMIQMPSSNIVEISQTFYWPLYTKPIDWIYQSHISDLDEAEQKTYVARVVQELQGLLFTQDILEDKPDKSPEVIQNGEASRQLEIDVLEEKEDWFNDLSGGQKSKVELVRKVSAQNPPLQSILLSELSLFCTYIFFFPHDQGPFVRKMP